MTAILSGKHVIAPPKDIAEVQNAYEIYECMDTLNPYSVDDLLKAHSVMVKGLIGEAGEFRSRPVGVVDGEGRVLHFGTLPQYVPQLVQELLDWTKSSDIHMLIKSCVFHMNLNDSSVCRWQWPYRKIMAYIIAFKVESDICVAPDRVNHT